LPKGNRRSRRGKKEVPRLAGLDPRYLVLQIVEINLSRRPHPPVAAPGVISEEDAENLGQYFAQLQ
jgi:cytochrome c553